MITSCKLYLTSTSFKYMYIKYICIKFPDNFDQLGALKLIEIV